MRVAGCGDMSGDVFGNGMLLSKAIRLVAAFDHRHIFLDPDPDPAASWEERKRLFDAAALELGRLFDQKLITKGGGVFPRTLKRIPLSRAGAAPRSASRPKELDPESLINAILKAPVDLLWFGGIGTYVKASQRGQRRRSAIRPTTRCASSGDEVRAKVIGEGANLGVTQAGRIEFALARRAHQHRLHRQFGRASIARTTRSTSRSRSPRPSAPGS